MRPTPLVSIVVNNYNYGRFLREAIDSALTQTYHHTEVVVVDDGSTDDSQQIILGYGDRVVSVLKENGGQASAFNAGFAKSRGEIVIFLDADDYLFPQAVERVVAVWRPGVAKVQYRLKMVDTSGDPIGFYPPLEKPLDRGDVLPIQFEFGTYVSSVTSGNGISRAVLDQVLPAPEDEFRISADGYLQVTVPFYGWVEAIDEALGAYRIHGHNLWVTEYRRKVTRRDATAVHRKLTFLQHKVLRHKLICHKLMIRKAEELGYFVPSIWNHKVTQCRIALLRLDPRDPLVSSDSPVSLVIRELRAMWLYSEFGWRRRLIHSAWLLSVGLLPRPIAKTLIAWLFIEGSRPRAVEWVRGLIRGSRPEAVGRIRRKLRSVYG